MIKRDGTSSLFSTVAPVLKPVSEDLTVLEQIWEHRKVMETERIEDRLIVYSQEI